MSHHKNGFKKNSTIKTEWFSLPCQIYPLCVIWFIDLYIHGNNLIIIYILPQLPTTPYSVPFIVFKETQRLGSVYMHNCHAHNEKSLE